MDTPDRPVIVYPRRTAQPGRATPGPRGRLPPVDDGPRHRTRPGQPVAPHTTGAPPEVGERKRLRFAPRRAARHRRGRGGDRQGRRRRLHTAVSSASSASSVRSDRLTCHPTTRRENTTMTKAAYP